MHTVHVSQRPFHHKLMKMMYGEVKPPKRRSKARNPPKGAKRQHLSCAERSPSCPLSVTITAALHSPAHTHHQALFVCSCEPQRSFSGDALRGKSFLWQLKRGLAFSYLTGREAVGTEKIKNKKSSCLVVHPQCHRLGDSWESLWGQHSDGTPPGDTLVFHHVP